MGVSASQLIGTAAVILLCVVISGLLAGLVRRFARRLSLRSAVLLSGLPAPFACTLLGPMLVMRGAGVDAWLRTWHLADAIGMAAAAGFSLLASWTILRGSRPASVDPGVFS